MAAQTYNYSLENTDYLYDIQAIQIATPSQFELTGENIVAYLYDSPDPTMADVSTMQRMELGQTYRLKNALIVVYPDDMMAKGSMSLVYKYAEIQDEIQEDREAM